LKENHIIQIIKNIDLKNESKLVFKSYVFFFVVCAVKISQYTDQNENDNKIDDL
jgi:hypothetical protein